MSRRYRSRTRGRQVHEPRADCLQRIAATLDATGLCSVSSHVTAMATLSHLNRHDGPSARITRRAVAGSPTTRSAPHGVPACGPAHPTSRPSSRLCQISRRDACRRPSADAREAAQPTRSARHDWRVHTGCGAVTLTAGITLWALSQRDARDYYDTKVVSMSDADRAHELEDRAGLRAAVGRGLVVSGTLAAVAGTVALLWTPLRHAREPRTVSLQLTPTRRGFGLGLGGVWRGGL